MNILHVIPGDLWAGAEAQVFYTVKALRTYSQHKIKVIVFNRSELYQRLVDAGVHVILFDESRLGSAILCNRIKQVLTDYNVHVVHVHEYKSHILTALARVMLRNKCALFRTLHGQNVPSRLKSYLVLGCQSYFLQYLTDHLIAVSDELKRLLSQKYTKPSIHLIYNAVDLSLLPSIVAVSEVRRTFGVPEKQFWIGTTSRLEVVKNLPMLINAAGYLIKKYPKFDFRISIFGEGALRDNLQRKIAQHGLTKHVFLEGHNSNIMPILQSLDVFTLTSHHEGLPMSLLEAMSVKTIPVCTAVGGMKEVVTDGEDGFFVSPDDSEELAETFMYIYCNRKELHVIGDKANEKIRKNFSVEQNCKHLLSLYENYELH